MSDTRGRGARYPSLYLKGLSLFNDGRYFEAHEVLEDLWRVTEGPEREFYQGIIQLAVALHHLARGNLAGAESLLTSCRRHLSPLTPQYGGLDVALVLALAGDLLEAVGQSRHEGTPGPGRTSVPRLWPADADEPASP